MSIELTPPAQALLEDLAREPSDRPHSPELVDLLLLGLLEWRDKKWQLTPNGRAQLEYWSKQV
ncbi:MAG TPA: hypothetical protein VGN97_02500 [Mesorhizobium sp.]|jgi:hypothetical protein|nr:hypothetical protein [Mesorhizobium sp.]